MILMELTGNEDRPQFDKFMWERKEKNGGLGNYSGGRFPPLYKPPLPRVHQQCWLAAAEEGSGCDDHVDAQEEF
jgi:hypothetical protein